MVLGPTALYIKHFPAKLSLEDRKEFLKTVGAVKVQVMPDNGKMKYCAFATFNNHEDAKYVLSFLHQREILGQRLVVEFAKDHYQNLIPHESDYDKFQFKAPANLQNKSSDAEILKKDMEYFSKKLHGVAPALGLDYLPSPLLKYKYPPPTPTIIQNINHALVSYPKFYTQVLHLMNKMNLPAPFGLLTPVPPITPDVIQNLGDTEVASNDDANSITMDSATESEYESESESDEKSQLQKVLPQKRPQKKPIKKRKKKMSDFLPTAHVATQKPKTEPSDIFESQPIIQKKINMKKIDHITTENSSTAESVGGFGAFESSKVTNDDNVADNDSDSDIWRESNFISLEKLREKRISSREMKTMSIFRNYSPGEPTFRLYIKNLARQVEEKDLKYIFGRFIDRNVETDRNMFDIRLMKEGRMKGQAFVTLANEGQAMEAIKQTNGFVLHTKPLVVQFARCAKPKENSKKDLKT